MHSLFRRKWTFCHFNRTSNKMKNNRSLLSLCRSVCLFLFSCSHFKSNGITMLLRGIQAFFLVFLFFLDIDRCVCMCVGVCKQDFSKTLFVHFVSWCRFDFSPSTPFHISIFCTPHVRLILILLLESEVESSCRSLQQIITNYTRGVLKLFEYSYVVFISIFVLFSFPQSTSHYAPSITHWFAESIVQKHPKECEIENQFVAKRINQLCMDALNNTHLSSLLFVPF